MELITLITSILLLSTVIVFAVKKQKKLRKEELQKEFWLRKMKQRDYEL